jgi:type VI protein secretion system component Hcp
MNADIFLKLTGPQGEIKGESKDAHFLSFVEVDDFELSARSMEKYHAAKEKERREDDDGGGDVDRPLHEKPKSKSQIRNEAQVPLKSDGEDESAFTLKITKDMDYVSGDLAQSYSWNLAGMRQKFPKIRLYLRKRGTENFVYLVFTFKDCYVVNYHLALSGGGTSIPVETVEFTFSGCVMKYKPQTEAGGERAAKIVGWDFKKRERDDRE